MSYYRHLIVRSILMRVQVLSRGQQSIYFNWENTFSLVPDTAPNFKLSYLKNKTLFQRFVSNEENLNLSALKKILKNFRIMKRIWLKLLKFG
jgi:hypothetical protein